MQPGDLLAIEAIANASREDGKEGQTSRKKIMKCKRGSLGLLFDVDADYCNFGIGRTFGKELGDQIGKETGEAVIVRAPAHCLVSPAKHAAIVIAEIEAGNQVNQASIATRK